MPFDQANPIGTLRMNGHTPDSLIRDIIRYKHAGRTNAEIALATGIPEQSVKNCCHRRHIRLRDNGRMVFKIAPQLREACNTEAQRRGLTINAFLRQMLAKIVEDKLFNAIFDDGK